MNIREMGLGEFLDALADRTPVPGGGAVASMVAALGAALGQMVVNYSTGKKSLSAHASLHAESLESLKELSDRAMQLAQDDAAAYGRLNALWKLDKDDPVRIAEFPAAVEQAIAAPHAVVLASADLVRRLHGLCGTTNRLLASDLAIAAILAESALRAGAWNVRINIPLMADPKVGEALWSDIEKSMTDARKAVADIEEHCRRPPD